MKTTHSWWPSIVVGAAFILVFAAIMTAVTLPLKTPGMGLAFHISGDSTQAVSSLVTSDARYISDTRVSGLIAIFVPETNTLEKLLKSGFIFVAKAEAGCLQWTKTVAQDYVRNSPVKRT